MKKVKITKEMLTDYIGSPSVEELTVEELLEYLRTQPDGAGNMFRYILEAKTLKMLKKELDRYFSIPEKMPADEQKKFEADVLALYLNPNRMPLTMCYSHAKDIFNLRGKRYMFPTLGSIKRKLSSIPAEIISTARGE
jgi:hypothetical protein